MNTFKSGIVLVMIIFTSCGNNFTTIDINHFAIDNAILKDKTPVKVLSFSGMPAPDINKKIDYYIHMIIVSLENNDTLNFLTINPAGILTDKDKKMNFFSEESLPYQTLITSQGSKNKTRLNKVVFDKNFIKDITNSYPTVIGILGNVTKY